MSDPRSFTKNLKTSTQREPLHPGTMDLAMVTVQPDGTKNIASIPRRIVLTRDQAREIFLAKHEAFHKFNTLHGTSTVLSAKYDVSAKAIRDIWKGRSWLEATFDLWDVDKRPAKKAKGRPKGRKDSKPRERGRRRNIAQEFPYATASSKDSDRGAVHEESKIYFNRSLFCPQPTQQASSDRMLLSAFAGNYSSAVSLTSQSGAVAFPSNFPPSVSIWEMILPDIHICNLLSPIAQLPPCFPLFPPPFQQRSAAPTGLIPPSPRTGLCELPPLGHPPWPPAAAGRI